MVHSSSHRLSESLDLACSQKVTVCHAAAAGDDDDDAGEGCVLLSRVEFAEEILYAGDAFLVAVW